MGRSSVESGDGEGLGKARVLAPGEVRARQDERGHLTVRLPDGSEHVNVRLVPAFPITRPNRFLYLVDEAGQELGVLADPRRLDRESREVILAQADQAYFMPRITRIIRVDENQGVARWEVETDRGYNAFDVVTRSESTWFLGKNRVLIRDADGNRYLIEDLSALDKRSRQLADLYL